MAFTTFAAPFTRAEYPDEFLTVRCPLVGFADIDNVAIPFAVLDRAADVVSIVARATTWGTSNKAITFYAAPSGTAIGSGTALGAAATISGLTANTAYSYALTEANCQNLAAGTTLGLGGASDIDGLAGFYATVRLRTARYRTPDGTNKVFNLG